MDLIDRQALTERKFPEVECNNLGEGPAYRQGWNDAIDAIIDNEPSAQPNTFNALESLDCVDRQAAIDAVNKALDRETLLYGFVRKVAIDAIRLLPSAQPERKPGKWIYGEDEYGVDGYHCDECGFFVPWDYAHMFINYIEDYNFCPSCGADMRGEQDG